MRRAFAGDPSKRFCSNRSSSISRRTRGRVGGAIHHRVGTVPPGYQREPPGVAGWLETGHNTISASKSGTVT